LDRAVFAVGVEEWRQVTDQTVVARARGVCGGGLRVGGGGGGGAVARRAEILEEERAVREAAVVAEEAGRKAVCEFELVVGGAVGLCPAAWHHTRA